jgi:hypothetical protein
MSEVLDKIGFGKADKKYPVAALIPYKASDYDVKMR